MAVQVKAMLTFKAGSATVDYGNNIRQMAFEEGENAFDFPGLCRHIYALFCEVLVLSVGRPSGDPEDIYKTDQKVKELIPDNPHLHNWLDMA